MRRIRKINVVLLVILLLCLTHPAAAGDELPFVGTLEGQVVSAIPQDSAHMLFDANVIGHATHLGRDTVRSRWRPR